MYVTSISTLVMLTALILAVVISYTSSSSREPNQKPQGMGANGDTPKQNPFVAAINKALNLFASKKKDKKPEGQRNLNLQFSEGDVSDEENSEIINILDRKQYHERQAATA